MRLKLNLRCTEPMDLPLSYNQTVQGFIYHNLSDRNLQQFIHNEGFKGDKRNFKFFSFSRLQGAFTLSQKRKRICFHNQISLQITSLFRPFIEDLATTLMKKEELMLANQRIYLEKMEMERFEVPEKLRVQTLSPIVLYSTFQNEHKKLTYYYGPDEPQFPILIQENLHRKAKVLYNTDQKKEFSIKPIYFNRSSPNIVHFKDFIIKGYSGAFEIQGDSEWMEIAYHYGLGSKNSQGFGMIEKAAVDL